MFVQIITGTTRDAEAFIVQGAPWNTELRPGATGFLGSTAGVGADGTVVVLARFADEAAAPSELGTARAGRVVGGDHEALRRRRPASGNRPTCGNSSAAAPTTRPSCG